MMYPIRVLQVVTVMNRGGAETLLMNLYRNIDRTKVQFDFLTHRLEEGAYDQEINSLGGKVFHLHSIRPYRYRKYFLELDNFFLNHKEYRVVHSHINENSSFVLRAAQKAGVPIRIAHSHISELPIDYKLPFRYYARCFLKGNTTHYFACSKEAGRWLFGEKIPGEEITVLKNGTDYEIFKHDSTVRDKIRNELGIENQLVIGHVGRFQHQKNHKFLIEVFKEVHRRKPNSILLLIGEGELMEDVISQVRKLKLNDNVVFLGVRRDIPQLMSSMDLFLFPSIFEGLPVALVEAQAAGLHCIVSDTITKESDIGANLLQYVELDATVDAWADIILKTDINHYNSKIALSGSGFEIKGISHIMEEFYVKSGL